MKLVFLIYFLTFYIIICYLYQNKGNGSMMYVVPQTEKEEVQNA